MSFLPSCHEVQTELTEYMEGTLPFSRRAGIWIHLLLCKVCAGFLRGLRALPGIAKVSLAVPQPTPKAADEVMASVQAAIRNRD